MTSQHKTWKLHSVPFKETFLSHLRNWQPFLWVIIKKIYDAIATNFTLYTWKGFNLLTTGCTHLQKMFTNFRNVVRYKIIKKNFVMTKFHKLIVSLWRNASSLFAILPKVSSRRANRLVLMTFRCHCQMSKIFDCPI